MRSVAPLVVRLARAADSTPVTLRFNYDCTTETNALSGKYTLSSAAATGTWMTRADSDPTRDESTDHRDV